MKEANTHNLKTPTSPTRIIGNNKKSPLKYARAYVGTGLEYLWELSSSIRSYKVDVVIVTGQEKHCKKPLRTLYIGNNENFAFIFNKIYSSFEVTKKRTDSNAFHTRKWICEYRNSVDLIVIDVELLFSNLLPKREFLGIPQWLKQKFSVPDTWEDVWNSFRKNTKKELRRILKYGFTYKMTRSERDFKIFYHQMYAPYIKKRFGDEAVVVSERKFLRQCSKGELMMLSRDGKVILGTLLLSFAGRLATIWGGVSDKVAPNMLKGAFSALDYFIILHGYERGCHTISFGLSRPLLNDGCFRYKRKWGTIIEKTLFPRADILIKPLSSIAPITSFFAHNPFITGDGKYLVGKILFDKDKVTETNINHCLKYYSTNGLNCLKLFSLHGFEDAAKKSAKFYSKEIRLFDLSHSSNPAQDFSVW